MNVEQIMNREVKACSPHSPVEDAVRIMWDNDCGCVPVVDETNSVVGMLTDRDVCMAAWSRGRTLAEMPVSTVMSTRVYACSPMDSIESAEETMKRQRIRRLPVLGAGKRLIGILSLNDIAREWHASTNGIPSESLAETLAHLCQGRKQAEQALEPVAAVPAKERTKVRGSLVGAR
jgi:CBS domain-containing protein